MEPEEYLNFVRRANLYPRREHFCSVPYCDPLNESGLRSRGFLSANDKPHTDDTMYICKYGAIHICTPYTCADSDGPEGCPISGLSSACAPTFGDNYDPRHKSSPPASRYKRHKAEVQETEIENVVETLLYSDFRKHVNEEWIKKQQKACRKEKDSYVEEKCDKLPINIIGLLMIESKYDLIKQRLPLTVFPEPDRARVAAYTSIISQVCQQALGMHVGKKLCYISIALGVLYLMQCGLTIDGRVVLPKDDFLEKHLPAMNDLSRFKIDRRKFAQGEKLIKQIPDLHIKETKVLSEEEFRVFMPQSRTKWNDV